MDNEEYEMAQWRALLVAGLKLKREEITYRPVSTCGVSFHVAPERLSNFQGFPEVIAREQIRAAFKTPFGIKYAVAWVEPEEDSQTVLNDMMAAIEEEVVKCLKSSTTASTP